MHIHQRVSKGDHTVQTTRGERTDDCGTLLHRLSMRTTRVDFLIHVQVRMSLRVRENITWNGARSWAFCGKGEPVCGKSECETTPPPTLPPHTPTWLETGTGDVVSLPCNVNARSFLLTFVSMWKVLIWGKKRDKNCTLQPDDRRI